jgi:hypothetical protein
LIISNGNKKNFRVSCPSSEDDYTINNVIGNKRDSCNCDSIYGRLLKIKNHLHTKSKTYPTLSDGVVVTSHSNSWTLDGAVEIIPANTVTSSFYIHWIVIEEVGTNDIYEISLYSGLSGEETELGAIRVAKTTVAGNGSSSIYFQCEEIPANTRISAKCASKKGGGSITISLAYHIS